MSALVQSHVAPALTFSGDSHAILTSNNDTGKWIAKVQHMPSGHPVSTQLHVTPRESDCAALQSDDVVEVVEDCEDAWNALRDLSASSTPADIQAAIDEINAKADVAAKRYHTTRFGDGTTLLQGLCLDTQPLSSTMRRYKTHSDRDARPPLSGSTTQRRELLVSREGNVKQPSVCLNAESRVLFALRYVPHLSVDGNGVSMTAELDLSPVDASNGVLAVSDRHERYGRGVWQALDEAIATDLAAAVKRSDFASFGASSRAGASLMDILEDKMQEGEKLMEQSVEEAIQSLESGELNVPYSRTFSMIPDRSLQVTLTDGTPVLDVAFDYRFRLAKGDDTEDKNTFGNPDIITSSRALCSITSSTLGDVDARNVHAQIIRLVMQDSPELLAAKNAQASLDAALRGRDRPGLAKAMSDWTVATEQLYLRALNDFNTEFNGNLTARSHPRQSLADAEAFLPGNLPWKVGKNFYPGDGEVGEDPIASARVSECGTEQSFDITNITHPSSINALPAPHHVLVQKGLDMGPTSMRPSTTLCAASAAGNTDYSLSLIQQFSDSLRPHSTVRDESRDPEHPTSRPYPSSQPEESVAKDLVSAFDAISAPITEALPVIRDLIDEGSLILGPASLRTGV